MQAGTPHQLIVATLYDLLFSPWAVLRTEQRIVEVEKIILKSIAASGRDICKPELQRQYIESLYKHGLGVNGYLSGVFGVKDALNILTSTAGVFDYTLCYSLMHVYRYSN